MMPYTGHYSVFRNAKTFALHVSIPVVGEIVRIDDGEVRRTGSYAGLEYMIRQRIGDQIALRERGNLFEPGRHEARNFNG
jgi:hypothetical protein